MNKGEIMKNKKIIVKVINFIEKINKIYKLKVMCSEYLMEVFKYKEFILYVEMYEGDDTFSLRFDKGESDYYEIKLDAGKELLNQILHTLIEMEEEYYIDEDIEFIKSFKFGLDAGKDRNKLLKNFQSYYYLDENNWCLNEWREGKDEYGF